MTEKQKYLFDVAGYLLFEDILSVDHCKRLIDALHETIETPKDQLPKGVYHNKPGPGEIGIGDLTSIGPIFADLIDLPPVIEILNTIISNQLRLEVSYGRIRRKGYAGLNLHGGGGGVDPNFTYHHFNGKMFGGHTVVSINLTDVSEEEGGFVCVPGSHNSHFPTPRELAQFEDGKVDTSVLRSVPCKAGSVVIFTEALAHGAVPWNSEQDRVNLFYKYNHAGMKWRAFWPSKEALEKMTPTQRLFYREVSADPRKEPVIHPGS